jgi:hypothetical protein
MPSSKLTLLCLLATAACADSTPSPVHEPARILVAAGDAQHAAADATLPAPVQFRVVDATGNPVAHVTVHLRVVSGSGHLSDENLVTDDQGSITVTWTLGSLAGLQRVEARVGAAIAVEVSATACLAEECVDEPVDEVSLLTLPTYDGSGQVVHPDVARATGSLSPFWLAITPYPGGSAAYENPSLFEGVDRRTWSIPPGGSNPVERPPLGKYLSDPDIVFDDATRRLWLFYREVIDGENRILAAASSDGTHWSAPATVTSAANHQIVSPSVVRTAPGAPWLMWAVNAGPAGCAAATTTVERRSSTDGTRWTAPVATDLAQPGRNIWHIDVQWIPARLEYWALYNTFPTGTSCVTDAIYLATSPDGLRWTTYPSPVARRGMIDAFADIVYRSTFLADPARGTVTLWISGAKFTAGIGYNWQAATVTRRIADLFATITAPPAATLRIPVRRDLPAPEPDVGTP